MVVDIRCDLGSNKLRGVCYWYFVDHIKVLVYLSWYILECNFFFTLFIYLLIIYSDRLGVSSWSSTFDTISQGLFDLIALLCALISQREPEEPEDATKGRDVFNEKPPADELLDASDIGKSVTTSLPDNVVSYFLSWK